MATKLFGGLLVYSQSVTLGDGIQILIPTVLVVYTWATLRIMIAAQEQAEGTQKPCLMLRTQPREADAAILQMDDTAGAMTVGDDNGKIALQNIGSGPALNVRCRLRATNFRKQKNAVAHESYLQNIPPAAIVIIPIARETLRFVDYEFSCAFESLSGTSPKS